MTKGINVPLIRPLLLGSWRILHTLLKNICSRSLVRLETFSFRAAFESLSIKGKLPPLGQNKSIPLDLTTRVMLPVRKSVYVEPFEWKILLPLSAVTFHLEEKGALQTHASLKTGHPSLTPCNTFFISHHIYTTWHYCPYTSKKLSTSQQQWVRVYQITTKHNLLNKTTSWTPEPLGVW